MILGVIIIIFQYEDINFFVNDIKSNDKNVIPLRYSDLLVLVVAY